MVQWHLSIIFSKKTEGDVDNFYLDIQNTESNLGSYY